MSEPTNPLFEEEKAFLERKKLEYERALRGDLAMLKQQTTDAGRVALVGAGLAGSIWLITKAFSSRKKKRTDRDEYRADYDTYDDYPTQYFGDYDDDRDDGYAPSRWHNDVDAEVDDYFADQGSPADTADYYAGDEHGTVYHSDTDRYDTPGAYDSEASAYDSEEGTADLDDNGLHDYPDFPAHSERGHGPDAAATPGHEDEHFESEAYGHPESTLPFDDSRRLPGSEDFAEPAAHDEPAADHSEPAAHDESIFERLIPTPPAAAQPQQNLGAMLVGLARTNIGKVIVGQAFSFGLALAAKAIRQKLEHSEPETAKTSDLAASTDSADGYAHGHPATPQPDAHQPSADASPF